MKKLIALTLLLCTLILMLSSCGNNVKIEKPEDTNLEYWLGEVIDNNSLIEISAHYFEREYISPKYEMELLNQGYRKNCVLYSTERFPISEFGIHKVSSIYITTPEVRVWGLTMNSTRDEVHAIMLEHGFTETLWQKDLGRSLYKKGDYVFEMKYGRSIHIWINTTSVINEIVKMLW